MRHTRYSRIGRAVALATALAACGTPAPSTAPPHHQTTERSSSRLLPGESQQAADRCSRALTPHIGEFTNIAIGADMSAIPTCTASALYLSTRPDAGNLYPATATMVSELEAAYRRLSPPNLRDAPRFDQLSRDRLVRAVSVYQTTVKG